MRALASSTAVVAAALWLAKAALPAGPPKLVDQFGDPGDPRASAPIVIVGVIASDTVVRRPVPTRDGNGVLQLRKMAVTVENVLKGDLSDERVEIYYFTFAGGFDGPQPLGFWKRGSRRIFWLRRDGGVLRTTCDGWDGCTWGVYSGAHPQHRVNPAQPLDAAIAEIAFTRGEGRIDEAKFAGAIELGAPAAEAFLVRKYSDLAIRETSAIHVSACLALWIWAHEPALRAPAEDGMRQGRCDCKTDSRGEPDCGPTAGINGDPPF